MNMLREVIAIYKKNMLIKTKFQIPDFGNDLIKRKRLFDKMGQKETYKIIMVTAPAGYGKTALISSWIKYEIKMQNVTWLTLDDEDNDEEWFWSYFLQSFYQNIWVPEEMKQRGDAMFCHAVPFSRLLLISFINDMIELGEPITMVFDNFGVIQNQEIMDNLEYLIRHLPSNVHLIFSGRETLEISVAKQKAYGEVLVLTGEELAFKQEETISFFRSVKHINLSEEEYGKVSHIFEGWIAGMQLIAPSIKDFKKLIYDRTHGLSVNLVYTYWMEEVICRLDDTEKKFLIETSIFEQFCPELCDFVFPMEIFDTDNAGEIIRKLESLSPFLTCLDGRKYWFRYHKLFRDFLQTFLPKDKTKYHLSLYQKASDWYKAKKDWEEAIHYAIKGQDFDKAEKLIEEFSREFGCRGESSLLHKWNQYLPIEMVENNLRLLLNSAWAYSSEGNTSKLIWCMKKVQRFETISPELQAEIIALYSSNLSLPQVELDTILMECRQALELFTPREFLMQLICFNIGGILLLKGSLEESLFYFEQCYIHSLEAGNFYLAIVSKKAIITSWIRSGDLQKAEQEILRFLKVLADAGGQVLSVTGLLYAQLAEIYYQRNELTEARNMAIEGNRYGELGEDAWTTGENYLILEQIYRAMNDWKQIKLMKEKILVCLEGRIFFDLGIKLECSRIQSLISERKLTTASRKISSLEEILDPKLNIVYPEFAFVKARFYENKGNFNKAEQILLSLKTAAKISGQMGVLCEVQVFLSAIYEKRGNYVKALTELKDAVSLAGVQGNVQFFLKEGSRMEGMLNQLAKKEDTKMTKLIFLEGLLCCFEKQQAVCELSEKVLSAREIMILNLVAQGAGNEEIADKLFVSKNTVKTHLLNIYTKLGVHSRTKAVSKAEVLHIITPCCLLGDS